MPPSSKVLFAAAVVCAAVFATPLVLGAVNLNPSGTSTENAFKQCLVSQSHVSSLGYCLGFGAIAKLQSIDSSPEFDLVDGVTFTRDDQMYRDGYSTLPDVNPSDFRSIAQSWSQVFSSRSMKWDMDFLYPGLAMKISQAPVTGGVLEFVIDNPYAHQQPIEKTSTGSILAKQVLVPMLTGIKFNVANLIPLFFGAIALMAKKALVLSKIALVVSSAFAVGSLLFANQPATDLKSQSYQSAYTPGYGYHYRYPEHEEEAHYQEHEKYRSNPNVYSNDQFRLYDAELQKAFSGSSASSPNSRHESKSKKEGRNFAWSEAEKKMKL